MTVSPIQDIIADIKAGKMVILVDEEDRENEGDLVLAAQFATPDHINFMAKYGRGLICLTLTEQRCTQLGLQPMVSSNRSPLGTNFTVSIEAATGVTTGISAADRATTIQAAVKPDARPDDIVQPGHIFPLRAQTGGVLVRAGHTEAGCDLAHLAGLTPASVICEILKDDGTMARLPDLIEFAAEHGLKIGTIADLIHYRNQTEKLVERVDERDVETPYGPFHMITYHDKISDDLQFVLVKGEIVAGREILVRVHEPFTALDLLDHRGFGHSWSVADAMRVIGEAEAGVIILMHRPEDTGNLLRQLKASYSEPKAPPKFDLRNYGIGAQILRDLGVTKMRLLAKQRRMPSVAGFDLAVTDYVACESDLAASNDKE